MLSTKRYCFTAAALPLALAIFLGIGSLYSCSENPPTGGKDTCDTCQVPCDTCDTNTHPCDTCNVDKDSAAHAFIWTEYSIPDESNITGCWVFGRDSMLILGRYIYWFNGTTFTKLDPRVPPSRPISGGLADFTLFAHSPTDYWMVHGSIAFHVYADVYAEEYRPGSVNACWGKSSNDMFFVGNGGQIYHFNGTTFTKMTSPTTKNLRSVWGTSHNDVWAGGSNYSTGEVVLLHFDGTTWKEVDLNTIGQFGCAGCESVAAVWAVDSSGTKISYVSGGHLHKKIGNKPWSIDSAKHIGNELSMGSWVSIQSIRGNSSTDLICVGDWGFVSHWNGKSWHRYDALYNPGSSLYYMGACDLRGNTACIVGSKDGKSWIAIGRRK